MCIGDDVSSIPRTDMDSPEPAVTEPLLDDTDAHEQVREVGREVWSRPTVTDAPGTVRNPAGLPVMFLMMDGDHCIPGDAINPCS
jgi:hypothetical protein